MHKKQFSGSSWVTYLINFVPACLGKVTKFHKGNNPGRSVQRSAKGIPSGEDLVLRDRSKTGASPLLKIYLQPSLLRTTLVDCYVKHTESTEMGPELSHRRAHVFKSKSVTATLRFM